MGRTLRIICGCVLASTLVGAAPSPSERAQAEQTQATQDLAKATEALARNVAEQAEPRETPLLERPCEADQDQRNSDLCAQWTAADAAREAARWAFWSTLVGIAGVIGLVLNLGQGRAALRRARDANEIARQFADRQLRPWMLFKGIEAQPNEDGSFTILVVWMNYGQSPAIDVEVLTRWCSYVPNEEAAPINDIAEAEGIPVIVGVVPPEGRAPNIIEALSPEQFWNERLSLTSRCRYRDAATETSHESLVTLMCWVIRGPDNAYAVSWRRLVPDCAD